MSDPLLVLDAHYLCHRAFHTAVGLSWKGRATGVIFGFLKALSILKDEFRTDRIAFCFEGIGSARRNLYPTYKLKREQDRSDEEEKAHDALRTQIHALRVNYLPEIGFRNIYCAPLLESDDLMAIIAKETPENDETILITADSDLLQCLRTDAVSIYNPQKMKLVTEHSFRSQYKIAPSQWAVVKAMAGCQTDNIKGIPGIGEKTALKYLLGSLPQGSKAHNTILSPEGKFIVRRNRLLVQLPFGGFPPWSLPPWKEDEITKHGWHSVTSSLGMKSLAGRLPFATRRRL